jgi:hypothetical protein
MERKYIEVESDEACRYYREDLRAASLVLCRCLGLSLKQLESTAKETVLKSTTTYLLRNLNLLNLRNLLLKLLAKLRCIVICRLSILEASKKVLENTKQVLKEAKRIIGLLLGSLYLRIFVFGAFAVHDCDIRRLELENVCEFLQGIW